MAGFNYPGGLRKPIQVEKRTEFMFWRDDTGEYRVAVELVQLEGHPKKHIRFAYWRKRRNSYGNEYWGWGSQNSWTFPVEITKQAIKRAEEMGFFDLDSGSVDTGSVRS